MLSTLITATRLALLAGDPDDYGTYWVGLTFEAAPEAASLALGAADSLSARFAKPPARSPALDSALSEIAARTASGELQLAGAMREVTKLVKAEQKAGRLTGAASMQALTWAPGEHESPFATYAVDPRFGALGLGLASGDLGRKGGTQYVLALLILADGLSP